MKVALCEGRPPISEAIDGSIFRREITDVTDTVPLESTAFDGLWNAAYAHYRDHENCFLLVALDWDGSDMPPLRLVIDLHVDLYVTGLTVALIATLNVCKEEGLLVSPCGTLTGSPRIITRRKCGSLHNKEVLSIQQNGEGSFFRKNGLFIATLE